MLTVPAGPIIFDMSNRTEPARLLLVAERPRAVAFRDGAPHVRRFRLARVPAAAASPASAAKRAL